MGKVSGAELLANTFKREGIDRVFVLSGDHINQILIACSEAGIRVVDARHEAAAAHMADALARVTGRPGVAIVTGGPGHTNTLTGLATAFLAGSPVILVSGCYDQTQADRYAFQELDQVALAKPITKWARLITDPRRIPEYVATAFREALSGRPGPVHLSIPIDVSTGTVEEAEVSFPPPERSRPVSRPQGDPSLIGRAIELLREAERPVLIAGSGAFWSQAQEALQRFIELTSIPLFTIGLARGLVSDLHPFCFGYADPLLNRIAQEFSKADVILLLGKRLSFRLGFGKVFDPKAKLIQVDIVPQELGRNREVEVGIMADARAALEQLIAEGEKTTWKPKPWVEHLRAVGRTWRENLRLFDHSDAMPIHPLRLCREVRELLEPDAIIVIDAGDFVQWARMTLPARCPGHWVRIGPLGTVGAAIPFGLAAKLAKPDKQVIVLIGDGGFGFHGFEFSTAVQHRIPLVVVVGNDRGWGMEREIQAALYGKIVACDLGLVRYDKVVGALGGHGEFVEKPEEIRPALERAFASGLPACMNVLIQGVRSPLTEASITRQRGARKEGASDQGVYLGRQDSLPPPPERVPKSA